MINQRVFVFAIFCMLLICLNGNSRKRENNSGLPDLEITFINSNINKVKLSDFTDSIQLKYSTLESIKKHEIDVLKSLKIENRSEAKIFICTENKLFIIAGEVLYSNGELLPQRIIEHGCKWVEIDTNQHKYFVFNGYWDQNTDSVQWGFDFNYGGKEPGSPRVPFYINLTRKELETKREKKCTVKF